MKRHRMSAIYSRSLHSIYTALLSINQQPVKIGVVRKKSSLKRRSRSSHEVTSSLRQRASLKKSASSNFPHVECRLSEQNDDLAVETNSPILR
uniref:Ovule protein n=1 Tax=Heterorhabditis bacteriophora TaxID=37862 RepID=A0A1I7XU54_HETBA